MILTSQTRLPSISEIIQSFPQNSNASNIQSQGQIRAIASTTRRLTGPSNVEQSHHIVHNHSRSRQQSLGQPLNITSVNHTPQSSILSSSSLSSPHESSTRKLPDYYYGQSFHEKPEGFRNFKFPASKPNESEEKIHESSSSITENFVSSPRKVHHFKASSDSMAFASRGKDFNEEDLIVDVEKLSTLTRSINKNIDVLQSSYSNLLDSAFSPENEAQTMAAEGIEDVKISIFKDYISSLPLHRFDSLIFDLNEDLKTINRLKEYKESLSKEKAQKEKNNQKLEPFPKVTPQIPSSSVMFKPHTNKLEGLSESKNSQEKAEFQHKRARSFQGSPKRQKSSHTTGGDVLHLDINIPVLETNAHSTPTPTNYLNKEFSLKKVITCDHCGSKDTPEWRKGPTGARTLCNACGLYYSKLIRKYGADEASFILKERKDSGNATDRKIM